MLCSTGFELAECEVCPSCSEFTSLASIITGIVTTLLASSISVIVTIAVCNCPPHSIRPKGEAYDVIGEEHEIYGEMYDVHVKQKKVDGGRISLAST